MKYLSQTFLFAIGIAVLLALQYHLWFGENGRADYRLLQEQIKDEQHQIDIQREHNRILMADVKDLKNGLEAVEEHARLDLGLIKPNETFVQMSTTATKTTTRRVQSSGKPTATIESIPEPLDIQ